MLDTSSSVFCDERKVMNNSCTDDESHDTRKVVQVIKFLKANSSRPGTREEPISVFEATSDPQQTEASPSPAESRNGSAQERSIQINTELRDAEEENVRMADLLSIFSVECCAYSPIPSRSTARVESDSTRIECSENGEATAQNHAIKTVTAEDIASNINQGSSMSTATGVERSVISRIVLARNNSLVDEDDSQDSEFSSQQKNKKGRKTTKKKLGELFRLKRKEKKTANMDVSAVGPRVTTATGATNSISTSITPTVTTTETATFTSATSTYVPPTATATTTATKNAKTRQPPYKKDGLDFICSNIEAFICGDDDISDTILVTRHNDHGWNDNSPTVAEALKQAEEETLGGMAVIYSACSDDSDYDDEDDDDDDDYVLAERAANDPDGIANNKYHQESPEVEPVQRRIPEELPQPLLQTTIFFDEERRSNNSMSSISSSSTTTAYSEYTRSIISMNRNRSIPIPESRAQDHYSVQSDDVVDAVEELMVLDEGEELDLKAAPLPSRFHKPQSKKSGISRIFRSVRGKR